VPHSLMNGGGEHVHADEREIALGPRRLLLQADDLAAVVEFCDTELSRVGDPGEHDLGVRPRGAELVDQRRDAADNEVVAEVHDEVVVTKEVMGDEHRVRQAERRLLGDVAGVQAQR
jgi:hypothetical protein